VLCFPTHASSTVRSSSKRKLVQHGVGVGVGGLVRFGWPIRRKIISFLGGGKDEIPVSRSNTEKYSISCFGKLAKRITYVHTKKGNLLIGGNKQICLQKITNGEMQFFQRELNICTHILRPRVARWQICKHRIPTWVNFGTSCNGRCWCILWPFGLFYGHYLYVFYGH
jgi:hypothetical protein